MPKDAMNKEDPNVGDDDEGKEPPEKRLRISFPDLKITVGGGSSGGGSGVASSSGAEETTTEQQNNEDGNGPVVEVGRAAAAAAAAESDAGSKVYWYHSTIMAKHSTYVDAMLSSPMRENATRELHFPEITPTIWDKMMKFVDDPSAARKMLSSDALEVAEYYDKYDFVQGRTLCDDVLVDFFKRVVIAEKNYTTTCSYACKIVHAIVVADACNLIKARASGMEHLAKKLSCTNTLYGRTMFAKHHIEKLVPSLIKEAEKVPKPAFLKSYTADEIRSPSFPELFVLRAQSFEMRKMIQSSIKRINVTVKGMRGAPAASLDFLYKKMDQQSVDGSCMFRNAHNPQYTMKVKSGAWCIVAKRIRRQPQQQGETSVGEEKVLYVSPCSGKLPLPPENVPWRRLCPAQFGDVVSVKYVHVSTTNNNRGCADPDTIVPG